MPALFRQLIESVSDTSRTSSAVWRDRAAGTGAQSGSGRKRDQAFGAGRGSACGKEKAGHMIPVITRRSS